MAKRAVIVLTALIILALIGLVGGMVYKIAAKPRPALAAGANAAGFVLPPGAQIVSSETQPGRLVLHVRNGGRDEIDIVNLDDGHLVARIAPAR